ncbi:SprT family zinc-dependent metalloprotease [Shewanella cyperi]|uniref:SprT family zinc-dependent metalloprotease n=1 Tax=Shewanella cyperi TaxID=2814292 RepID=UPI001A95358B|nr:SprT family zinc-dependent metalloprotease [Shewanella cyperi]QSX41314.1 SprT family zinc-dependent metalloprotease [Shewanella cyperi]
MFKRLFSRAHRPVIQGAREAQCVPATRAQEEAQIHLESACLRAEAVLGIQVPRPALSFKLRGRCAGMAHLQENRMRLNAVLLEENPQVFFTEVIPHELCHLLAYRQHGRVAPHGREWQALMRGVFGLAPRTTHSLDTQSVSRSVDYRCGCGTVPLSIRRHNKVVRGQSQYLCRRCGQRLSAA